MPKLDCPLLLSPVYKPKIWGRHNLAPLFANPAARFGKHELIGEVWITDDESRFMNGPLCDLTLAEASRKFGPELNGSSWTSPRFPILAKYLFTSDWLSIQVHPDDDDARVHDPGNTGKTEMWYFIQSDRGAEILLGLKPDVKWEELQSAFEAGTSRDLVRAFHPKANEAIYVAPGTVHALGPGLVLFEAEQNSDLTYRLDDFGRVGLDGKPRPLHWKKGREVTRLGALPLRELPHLVIREPFGTRRYVVAGPYFAVEDLRAKSTVFGLGVPERVEVYSILEGNGRVETDAGWLGYRAGDTWLIPPATGRYRIVPLKETRLLKFYLPDVDKDFRRPLQKRGARLRDIEKVCFNRGAHP